MKVAIVCEDHTNDQYILKPVVSSLMAHLGKRSCVVQIVSSPRIRGFDSLLAEVDSVARRYVKAASLLIVAFDLDCDDGSPGRRDKRAKIDNAIAKTPQNLDRIAILGSVQELEVYALWGSRSEMDVSWKEVRSDCHPKERFYDAVTKKGDKISPGGGRARLTAMSLASGWPALRDACPELLDLEERVKLVLRL